MKLTKVDLNDRKFFSGFPKYNLINLLLMQDPQLATDVNKHRVVFQITRGILAWMPGDTEHKKKINQLQQEETICQRY